MESALYLLTLISNKGKAQESVFVDCERILQFLNASFANYRGFEVERINVQGQELSANHGIYAVQYMRRDGFEWERAYFTEMAEACRWVLEVAGQAGFDVHAIEELSVYH